MSALVGSCSCDKHCYITQLLFWQVMDSIRDCFVTGKWEADKDAAKLLKEDGKLNTVHGLELQGCDSFCGRFDVVVPMAMGLRKK